jgi:hypothetical protein
MDDFLHNLRSGKLKQPDRSNRPYNDPQYKGGQRRNSMDRRRKELDAFERLNAVKEVLEAISETQKRMVTAYDARTRAEERKARAMEILAKNLYRMLNPEAKDADELFAQEPTLEICPPSEELAATDDMEAESEQEASQDQEETLGRKLTEDERQRLFVIIDRMRLAGEKWEKIARQIASEGFPTVSGKGNWRGIMAKTLYEKMLSE